MTATLTAPVPRTRREQVPPPRGMRTALVPVLRYFRGVDSPRERRVRASTLHTIAKAIREQDLAAIGVGELEQLADELDHRVGGES